MPDSTKVAKIRKAPSLGEHAYYAITYLEHGKTTAYSIARADEIEEWRTDLRAGGWTLDEAADA